MGSFPAMYNDPNLKACLSVVIHSLFGCQSHLVKLKKQPNPQRRKMARERLLMQLPPLPIAQEQNKCCPLLVKMVSSGIDPLGTLHISGDKDDQRIFLGVGKFVTYFVGWLNVSRDLPPIYM